MELSVSELYKNFKNFKALQNISFDVKQGDVLGILGANGAGKTTLLRIITGIVESSSGSILLNNTPLNYDNILKYIGYLPEERGLYKNMKAIDCIVFLASLKNISKNEALEFVKTKAIDLEIDFDLKQAVGSFSKGMQQKVQLLAATVHKPSILILDEPFSGLDPMNAQVIKKEIINLAQNGTTILMSTHRMDTFEDLCNTFLFLRKGHVLAKGSKSELLLKNTLIQLHVKNELPTDLLTVVQHTIKNEIHEYTINYSDSINSLMSLLINKNLEIISVQPHTDTLEDVFIKMNKNITHE